MKKILVIEDDSIIRNSILKFLQMESMEAVSASGGEAGVKVAQEQDPDLIICDISMPGWDGYQVLEALKGNPATARIPFIFLSAKSDRSDLRQGMEMGADDYITKPFTRQELLAAIAARLNKQAAITQPYVDAMKQAVDNLKQLAYRDALTGLPNRILFHHHLQEAISRAQANQTSLAVLYLSIDNSRVVNERLGQEFTDELLQAIAQRLQANVDQPYTPARLGVYEFGVIYESVARRQEVARQAQALLKHLLETYWVRGQWVSVQLSLGIALYPDNGTYPNDLMHHSRLAMQQARRSGENRYQFYNLEVDAQVTQRQWIAGQLPRALENGELQLQFQPQLHLITGRIIGAEAFVRWHCPEIGVLYPSSFLAIAQELELLDRIEHWILQTACQQAKTWQSYSQLPIKLLVNLSNQHLHHFNLVESASQVLEQTGLSPDLLVFDIQEADLMADVDAGVTLLTQLKDMGIRTLIDDFGIGFTSLSYLRRLPVEGVKIDTSLIADIASDPEALSIVKAIVAVAQSLQLRAIAEGVESDDQINLLRQSGCYAAQGRFLCPPLPSQEFVEYLQSRRRNLVS